MININKFKFDFCSDHIIHDFKNISNNVTINVSGVAVRVGVGVKK